MVGLQCLVAIVIVVAPFCSGLTSSEQRTLDRFDSKLAKLRKSLDELKAKVTTRKELIVNETTTQFETLNERRVNVTKIVRDHYKKVCENQFLYYQHFVAFYEKFLDRTLFIVESFAREIFAKVY